MTPETARNALAFLNRITLSPQEIQAFAMVASALNDLANPAPPVSEAPPATIDPK